LRFLHYAYRSGGLRTVLRGQGTSALSAAGRKNPMSGG